MVRVRSSPQPWGWSRVLRVRVHTGSAVRMSARVGWSPHPRGCSHGRCLPRLRTELLPAPAGMVPSSGSAEPFRSSTPGTRGDGSRARRGGPRRRDFVLPPRLLTASAGMVPSDSRASARLGSAPALAGMVPSFLSRGWFLTRVLYSRGCSRLHQGDGEVDGVCSRLAPADRGP